ncbi:YtxH domain-containing protein [Candidatus Falkowbacteria bacterium]|nr:YtxH domain-containing protein [Candidatus Falkowbacteria bacterium]
MKTKRFLGTLALGALIGSALGLFLSPATGKKNREKFKKVAKQVSETIVKEASKISSLSQKEYAAIVENIVKKYSKDDLMSKEAWFEIKDELLKRWNDVQKELKGPKLKKKKAKK